MYRIFLIGAGGFLGSIARYLSQQLAGKIITHPFPYGTFVVNLLGCFLIGVIYGFSDKQNVLSAEWRFFLATGFCGGYTTFSTFSYETLTLIKNGDWLYVSLYVTLSILLGVALTFVGVAATKLF